jgi:radial spoke head protein 4A
VELNKLGRVKKMPEQLDANGDPIVPDEEVEVTRSLNDLTPEAWTFRVGPGGAGSAAGSSVVARSLVWPGAVAVASGRRYVNCYVGNGVSYDPIPYSPPLLGAISTEWAPVEEEPALVEQADTRADPTPPKPEGEAVEE